MAYAFCIARAYADEVLQRGVPIDEFAGRLSFNFNIYGNLFEQVAKFRAGRSLWAKIVRDAIRRAEARLDVDAHDRRRRRQRAHVRAARAQHRARRVLRADQRAVRRADDGAVLLRRGVHDPERIRAAAVAAHDAAADRGDRALRHGRPARRLVLRRDADQPDARRNGADHRRGRRARRHRRADRRTAASRRRSRRRPTSISATSRPAASARSASTATASTRTTRRSSSTPTTRPARARRSARLAAVRAERDAAAVAVALDAVRRRRAPRERT